MQMRKRLGRSTLMILLACAAAHAVFGQSERIRNPGLQMAEGSVLPVGWTEWKPEVTSAACRLQRSADGLQMDAPDAPFGVGGIHQEIEGIEGGKSYAVEVNSSFRNLSSPYRSVLVRLTWRRGARSLHPAGDMLSGKTLPGGRLLFQGLRTAPAGADRAEISLELKWPRGGSVTWEKVSLKESEPVPSRKVKIGTAYLRPQQSDPERNLELFAEQIREAGRLGLDILCLAEAILAVGTRQSGPQTAEPIPGPSTERLGREAAASRIWVVAGLYEKEGAAIYNTAVLLDRQGRLAGKYRKVHLPREEWRLGITPGTDYPVFRTDFGVVAIQICYDWFFPEVASIWRLKGAEIVLAPTWGTTFPDQEGRVEGESVFRVRARDGSVYLVPSVYDGSSMVIDPLGRVLVSNRCRTGVFWAEADLSRREPLPWVGDWRDVGPRDRMPSGYSLLREDPHK